MGDRCYMRLRTTSDMTAEVLVEKFRMWFEDWRSDVPGIEFSVGECNYAYSEGRRKLHDAGGWFEGYHGGGDSYGPMVFASMPGEYVEVECRQGGMPVAEVDRDGTIDPDALALIADYWRVSALVEAHLEEFDKVREMQALSAGARG